MLPPGRWNPLKIAGQAPPPCSDFTLTRVGEKRAAMYGGREEWNRFNHLFIVELGRQYVVSVITRTIKLHSHMACFFASVEESGNTRIISVVHVVTIIANQSDCSKA